MKAILSNLTRAAATNLAREIREDRRDLECPAFELPPCQFVILT